MGSAYLYRIGISPGAVVESSLALSSSVNRSVRLVNDRAYAVTAAGQLHALNATAFGVGAFVNVSGFPYATAFGASIQAPAYITPTGFAYFGDDTGRLYSVTSAGASESNYPLAVSTFAITASPLYIGKSGVIAVGAADGFVYFIDRHDASSSPAVFTRYYVGQGNVASLAYDAAGAQYMATSGDGKLSFISASSVADPTSARE
jgi:hypothetical protein